MLREEGRRFPKKLPPLPSFGDKREAEALRPTLEMLNQAVSIPRLVRGDAWVGVRHAEAEGLVEEDRELARSRRDRLGLADARGQRR